ncbi:translation initiation factor IF-2 [Cladophialophora chaetospira]|uniref:Translation initiation factor IF-2, mitochondrial n=1 Tax=Cladophialophora chaetospira TaxID=386627 RepID=A0AA38XD73_9EURO|nr:translation initiation factor IF-2 [Cladophialophora chaetospira]
MRRTVARKLLQGQDICLLCAFRYGIQSPCVNVLRPQCRAYRAATTSRRPAAAAAARIEDEDDVSAPARELLGWRCRCNHVNKPGRSECTICLTPRPQNAQVVYRDLNPSPAPPPPPPPRARPAAPSNSRTQSSPGPQDPGSLSAILSQAQLDLKPRTRDRAQPHVWSRAGQPASGEQLPFKIRTHGFARESDDLTVAGNRKNDWRRPGPDSDRTVSRYPGPRGTVREPITRDSGVTNQVHQEPRYPSWSSRLQEGREVAAARSPRASPLQSRIGAALGRSAQPSAQSSPRATPFESAPAAPRAWAPMGPAPPRAPAQETTPSRDSGRGTRDRVRLWRPGMNGTDNPYRSTDQQNSRDQRTQQGPEVLQESADADDEGNVLGEARLVDETEDDWHRRKTQLGKDRDRRARLYEIEDDEPLQVSRPAKAPTARRSGVSRGTSMDFDYDPDLADELYGGKRRKKWGKQAEDQQQPIRPPEIVLPEFISVEQLAQGLKVRLPLLLRKLEEEGFEGARYDHILDSGTSAMFAEIYGYEPIIKTIDESNDIFPQPAAEDPSTLPPRPPVVTIMGHVDHGKTTILDYFRKANVVASEHGGITQHIGAFSVTMPGSERNITFLDTPGHAAFLEMRRRGAVVTDIVVLVVAADDSVKAQTIEAIKHAREAGVQMIIAINKVDKPGADVEKVKLDLQQQDIVVEDFGGEYQSIPVSGKTGHGMDDLEEAILALADVADFRAENDGSAEGWIIESRVGATGRVATVLVRRGTLRPGDFIVAGTTWARVRTLRNDAGELIDEAPPGTPVQIDGWRGDDPEAGLEVLQAENEQRAKEALEVRKERADVAREMDNMTAINASRTEDAAAREKVVEWEKEQGYFSMGYKRRPKDNEGWIEKESSGPQLVHFVIKADVAGSTEALVAAVNAIGNNEAQANIVHSGTGGLSESDIKMLAATGEVAYAISFNQPIDGEIRQLAAAARIQILDHNIIYKVTDDVTEKVSAELPPIVTQRVLGEAEVGDIFEIKIKKGSIKIAGCRVSNGTIRRSEKIRVLRKGEVVYTGTLNSFKNIKKDVTEMRKGSECGMGFENWDAFEVGDQIQSFEDNSEKRTLH